MLKSRRIPTWLARRTYFKRIERWAKPAKARKVAAVPETVPGPLPSNVVLFPVRTARPDRTPSEPLRGLQTA
jgi:hypothetical protein